MPSVYMDDRQVDWFQPALEAVGFTVIRRRLDYGDLLWDSPNGRVGVEDKPITDLMRSRKIGRLDDELRRLQANVAVPILLIREDNYYTDAERNLLLGRQMHGIYVTATGPTPAEVGERVASVYKYLSVARSLEGQQRAFAYLDPMDNRAEILYAILGLVKGIRGRRDVARQLAERYNVSEVLGWDATEFRKAGFSSLMARKLAEEMERL